jgi:hypothetical protein
MMGGREIQNLSSAQDEGQVIIEVREAIASLQLLQHEALINARHLGLMKQSTNLFHTLLLRLPSVACHPLQLHLFSTCN